MADKSLFVEIPCTGRPESGVGILSYHNKKAICCIVPTAQANKLIGVDA